MTPSRLCARCDATDTKTARLDCVLPNDRKLPLTLVPERDSPQLESRDLNGLLFLTSGDVLVRCQVSERAVRPALIVVDPPRFDLGFASSFDVNWCTFRHSSRRPRWTPKTVI